VLFVDFFPVGFWDKYRRPHCLCHVLQRNEDGVQNWNVAPLAVGVEGLGRCSGVGNQAGKLVERAGFLFEDILEELAEGGGIVEEVGQRRANDLIIFGKIHVESVLSHKDVPKIIGSKFLRIVAFKEIVNVREEGGAKRRGEDRKKLDTPINLELPGNDDRGKN